MKFLAALSLYLLCLSTGATSENKGLINIGPIQIGKSTIPIDLESFRILKEKSSKNIRAGILKGSLEWPKDNNNLLSPHVRLKVIVQSQKSISLNYGEEKIIPQLGNTHSKEVELVVNLLTPKNIEIYEEEKLIEILHIVRESTLDKNEFQLIDQSCSKYNVNISGLENQFLSIGCVMEKTGRLGKERPRLRITMASTNLMLQNGKQGPFTIYYTENRPVTFKVKDQLNKNYDVEITATIPDRLRRLHTAIGLGPYSLKTQSHGREKNKDAAPSFMLYSRFDLSEQTSLRAFNALIYSETIFNNLGLYFAYDLAQAFDAKLSLTALLGAQVLGYRYGKDDKTTNKIIYPQGLELTYKHAFGMKNYSLTYGMFLSTQSTETYDNLWLRFGKRYFLELNFIRWGRADEKVQTWGLSVGIPTGSYF